MPKIDVPSLPVREGSSYPAPFDELCRGRMWQALGKAVGLTQFGVNLVRLKPGAASGQRHWHEEEDELVWVLEGELVLVENEGETVLRPGDAAGFKAGVANGHHLVNRSGRDGVFLVVGTRAPTERCHYPDIDLVMDDDGGPTRWSNKAGRPYA